jgi:two-component system, chemotaxis family, protein-glutamate methylesterase/glutaminase
MGHILNEPQIARDLFAFGGSAGGLEALIAVFRRLPADLPVTICVALHRSPNSTSDLAGILARRCALPVSEPADGDAVRSGRVYLAPQDFHLTIQGESWMLDRDPKQHRMRPAVDPLFRSAAAARGERVVGVLLSGGGADGVEGLIAIKAKGGITLVQRPDEARQPSMPIAALREDDVDAAIGTDAMALLLPLLAVGGGGDLHALTGPSQAGSIAHE